MESKTELLRGVIRGFLKELRATDDPRLVSLCQLAKETLRVSLNDSTPVKGVVGALNRHGGVSLFFSNQDTALKSPGGGQYLPCSNCNGVHEVPLDCVGFVCGRCDQEALES